MDTLFGRLQQHAMIISMKEIYGWLCLAGLFCLLIFLLKESSLRPKYLHPKFSTIRRTVKHDLKMDKLNEDD
jgi:MFS transporter, DHA2 family, multidrug resistance protein